MQIKGKCMHVKEVSRNSNQEYADIVIGGQYLGANVKSEIIANQLKASGVNLIIAESFGRAFYT